MTAGTAETVVRAPRQRVFAQLDDPSSWSEWLPGHGGWPDGAPASAAEGETFRMRLGFFGIHDTVTVTIEESTEPAALVLLADGNHRASARMSFRLEPRGPHETAVRAEAEVIGTPTRAVASLASRALAKALRSSLAELAAQAETNPATERHHHVVLP